MVLFLTFIGNAQESISDLLSQHNHKNIPYISVQELASPKTQAIILDTREEREYETSHIKNALFVGYNHFSLDSVLHKISDKNEKIGKNGRVSAVIDALGVIQRLCGKSRPIIQDDIEVHFAKDNERRLLHIGFAHTQLWVVGKPEAVAERVQLAAGIAVVQHR